jgi:hypothetical protein
MTNFKYDIVWSINVCIRLSDSSKKYKYFFSRLFYSNLSGTKNRMLKKNQIKTRKRFQVIPNVESDIIINFDG